MTKQRSDVVRRTTTKAGHQAHADFRQLWRGISIQPRWRKMVSSDLPSVRAGNGAKHITDIRGARYKP